MNRILDTNFDSFTCLQNMTSFVFATRELTTGASTLLNSGISGHVTAKRQNTDNFLLNGHSDNMRSQHKILKIGFHQDFQS